MMTDSSGMRRIYLDYNASTPIDPRVWEAMCAAGKGGEGNPSSTHWAGAASKGVLERGRRQIASVLGCSAEEVVLTSGGSEANNLALKGVYFARRAPEAHLITTQVEHPSILSPCAFLERLGAKVTYLQ
jgi:cysteine desulfurase